MMNETPLHSVTRETTHKSYVFFFSKSFISLVRSTDLKAVRQPSSARSTVTTFDVSACITSNVLIYGTVQSNFQT